LNKGNTAQFTAVMIALRLSQFCAFALIQGGWTEI